MANSRFATDDAVIHAALASAGLGDACTFRPRSGIEQAGSCFVFRDAVSLDERGVEFRADSTVVHLLRAGITQAPRKDDLLIVDGETFTVKRSLDSDDGRWVLECSQ